MIQIGDKKVSKMMIAGNVLVSQDDVWLPCKVGPSFTSGIPILMHYDSSTGVTSFLGQAYFRPSSPMILDEDILTLPSGYHFTEMDPNFPFGWGGSLNNSSAMSLSEKNAAHAKYTLGSGNQSSNPVFQMCFGYIYAAATSQTRVWHTTTVEPD